MNICNQCVICFLCTNALYICKEELGHTTYIFVNQTNFWNVAKSD